MAGRRSADCVPAREEAPVIYPVAPCGPECGAVRVGSIKTGGRPAHGCGGDQTQERVARACTSHPDGRKLLKSSRELWCNPTRDLTDGLWAWNIDVRPNP